jgi:hypothetical protein
VVELKPIRMTLVGFAVAGAAAALGCGGGDQFEAVPAVEPATIVFSPAELTDSTWLSEAQAAQLETADAITVFHDFRFTDIQPESGLTWRHRIVNDAGQTYKAAHYDHGNGVTTADIDGDGRLDIYFVTQVGANGLFRNLGGGRFEDVTVEAGVAVADRIGVAASFADVDNDGDPDLYVTTVRGGNVLFENDGQGRFADISAGSGLDYVGHSSAAVFFDYDRDGLLDLFLVNVGQYTEDTIGPDGAYVGLEDAFSGHLFPERAEQSRLYRNGGGNRFTDVSDAVGLLDMSWSGDAAVIDGNQDGWADLYVLNMQGNDEYYENVDGERFERRSREVFPVTSWGSMGIQARDFDNDGLMDIFITDMHSDMSQNVEPEAEHQKADIQYAPEYLGADAASVFGNTFFRNLGATRFEEVSDAVGAENYWPWGLSTGDLNADGFEDAFLASGMNYPFRYSVNGVKLNDDGRFVDAEFILGVEPRRGGRTATPWFELDATSDAGRAELRGNTGRVSVWSALGSRSSVIFDLDDDGDLDIVTNDFNSEPMVLLSNLAEQTAVRFLAVRLTGSASNRDGLGAVVRVFAGGSTYTKTYDGQSGYLSHGLYPLYFGLGDATIVDRVEVDWPSGITQVAVEGIEANQVLEVQEP